MKKQSKGRRLSTPPRRDRQDKKFQKIIEKGLSTVSERTNTCQEINIVLE